MTREEALDIMKYERYAESYCSECPNEGRCSHNSLSCSTKTAYDMAINALKAIDNIKTEIITRRDTIDRAISEDELKIEGMKSAYNDALEIINKHILGIRNGQIRSTEDTH